MRTVSILVARLSVFVLVVAGGCGAGEDASRAVALPMTPPSGWGPVHAASGGPWSAGEAELLDATLFFVRETLPPDDPRRGLVERAHYLALDALAPEDGATPPATEALFSVRTGNIYVEHPTPEKFPQLASSLAHELHHMERDHTPSVNRMQECDRERVAHAREAEDVERMLVAVKLSPDAAHWLPSFELGHAKARALAAMYTSKFELFRLVQALDQVEGLREMSVLYAAYERCIEVAKCALATDHKAELVLLDELAAASRGSTAEALVAAPLQRARGAIEACAPLQATVDLLRAKDRSRAPGR